jgi:hypothetical protein
MPAQSSCNSEGRPLLSWRVHLLPFLGEGKLYNEFNTNEPWDSENNRRLIEKMPDCYRFDPENRPQDITACHGRTCYVVVLPSEALSPFCDCGTPIRSDATRGGDVIVIEVDDGRAVIWTKPDDITLGIARHVVGRRKGKVLALNSDGNVILALPRLLGSKDTREGIDLIQEPLP